MIRDGKFTATANGKLVVRDRATNKFTRRDDARVGLAAENAWPGTVVRFMELRVRRVEPQQPKPEPQHESQPQADR
jgi:hypothetical protein